MDNISFSKNAIAFPSDDRMVKPKTNVIDPPQLIPKVEVCLDDQISMCDQLFESVSDKYKVNAYKELYDVKIYLSMIKQLLKSVN